MAFINHLQNFLCLKNIVQCFVAVLFLFGLYLISLQNYLLFHGIVEVATIVIFFAIFVIVWNARRNITDIFFLIIGISCLFIGSIDLVHTLAYKGMGVFPGNDANLPTQLWIAARYYQSIAFLIATLLIGKSLTKDRKYDTGIVLAACAAGFALIMASIFGWQNFPPCYIEGIGLTGFKIASEYVISLVLLATIVLIVHKRKAFDPEVWKLLVAAMVFLIIGELAFTSYISVYGFMNMVGHLAKLVSVFFLYRAIVVVSISRPFDLLFRDLKERTEALQESEERYRTLFDNMIEGFAYCRMLFDEHDQPEDFIYISVNPAFDRITGIPTVTGKRVTEVFLGIKEAYPQLFTIYGRVTKTGTPESFELDFQPAGKWLHISVYSPAKEHFVAVFEDITERKKAEASLKDSEERYRSLYDDAPSAYFSVGTDGIINRCNKTAARITGIPVDSLKGMRVFDLYADIPEGKARAKEVFSRFIAGETISDEELVMQQVGGTPRWINLSVNAVRDRHGKIIESRSVVIDITERKQAESALHEANRKLNLRASITRHDILNQLFALRGYLDLSHVVIDDRNQMEEYLRKEETAAANIERQITFTRDYQDMGVKAPAWQNVNASVQKAVQALPVRNIRVEIDRTDLEIYADPLFVKVFYNLIDNALKYGGDNMMTIRVSAQMSKESLLLTCADDGEGIADEDKKRLFTRGFGKHTGLGLFLTREILAITGITIIENGVPGKGARFEIMVPKGAYRFAGADNKK